MVAALLICFALAERRPAPSSAKKTLTAASKPAAAQPQSLEGRYLFNGTVTWARAVEKWSRRPDGTTDYSHPFSQLSTFGREQYDEWIADLECPSADTVVPYQTQVDALVFNCRPEFMPEAAKYFSIFNLANNHTYDQGTANFKATQKRIAENGMQSVGNYDPTAREDVCEVVGLRVRAKMSDGTSEHKTLPVAFCAWHFIGHTPTADDIGYMTQYSKIMPVFAFVHMGTEYLTKASAGQEDIARRIVDAGADVVIANHPHWVQNTEAYKGKLIVYSTANFIFDQIDMEGMRSASIDMTFSVRYDQNVAKWLTMGHSCKTLHDTCFQQAVSQKLAKPSFTFKYAVVAGDNSSHDTHRGDAKLQQAIEARMNWVDTINKLAQ
jgi:hypothetical protein